MTEERSKEPVAAAFNMAQASLMRIHQLKIDSSEARRSGHVYWWYDCSKSIWSELIGMLPITKDEKDSVKNFEKVMGEISSKHSYGTDCPQTQAGRVNNSPELCAPHKGAATVICDRFDLFLSELMGKYKLVMPKSEDADDVLREDED